MVQARVFQKITLNARAEEYPGTARAEMWTQDKEGSLHVRLAGFWYNVFKINLYGDAIDNLLGCDAIYFQQ
eukprot:1484377-Rhodomonas_salina.1